MDLFFQPFSIPNSPQIRVVQRRYSGLSRTMQLPVLGETGVTTLLQMSYPKEMPAFSPASETPVSRDMGPANRHMSMAYQTIPERN